MPAQFADRAPRVVEHDDGSEAWVYDGEELPNVGFNAVVGRPVDEYSFEPTRFDEMRRGAWDIDARIADMDLNGVYASLNFPSFLPGFAGQRLQTLTDDPELALAASARGTTGTSRTWAGAASRPHHPVPDPVAARSRASRPTSPRATRRAASRRSRSPRRRIGSGCRRSTRATGTRSSRACAETETVVNLHIGSSGTSPSTTDDAPPDVTGVLFFGYAMFAAVDWLYSLIPVRLPDLKICLSEGGIGWVAGPARPPRPHAQLPRDVRHVDRHRAHAGRGDAAQLLVLRGRRPVGVRRSATASASSTSCSSPTTRTATRPGRAPSR